MLAVGKLLTTEQVAERLAVSVNMVLVLVRSGKLPAMRIEKLWRIDEDDLQEYLRSRYTKKTEEKQ